MFKYHNIKQDLPLVSILTIPALVLFVFGLYQLTTPSLVVLGVGLINKFIIEALFILLVINFLNIIAPKSKLVLVVFFLCYFLLIGADFVLLAYFKERFGMKYLDTMSGANYDFLLDFRTIIVFLSIAFVSYLPIKFLYKPKDIKSSIKVLLPSILLMFVFFNFPPIKVLYSFDKYKIQSFYANLLMNPSLTYIMKAVSTKYYEYKKYKNVDKLPPDKKELAKKFSIFNAKNTSQKNNQEFERVILLTTEAMSAKFFSRYNKNLSAEASPTLDYLSSNYPSTILNRTTLSTLYGLSVMFNSHPNVPLSTIEKYPNSFVKILSDQGFKTTFIRGAREDYMDEDKLFKQAGFSKIYGENYFKKQSEYKDYVAFWGLTDRKLFEFTIKYIKQNINKKLFIQILTVDTHIPLGRPDYLGQEYPEFIDEKTKEYYDKQTLASAFRKHDYDLKIFYEQLKKENILDDKTLLIITGDHPFFANVGAEKLFKPYKNIYDDVPIIFVSKNKIIGLENQENISQLDIAPTILDLLNIKIPQGYFGHSLLDNQPRTLFDMKESYVLIKTQNSEKIIPFNTTNENDKKIIDLLNTYIE